MSNSVKVERVCLLCRLRRSYDRCQLVSSRDGCACAFYGFPRSRVNRFCFPQIVVRKHSSICMCVSTFPLYLHDIFIYRSFLTVLTVKASRKCLSTQYANQKWYSITISAHSKIVNKSINLCGLKHKYCARARLLHIVYRSIREHNVIVRSRSDTDRVGPGSVWCPLCDSQWNVTVARIAAISTDPISTRAYLIRRNPLHNKNI